MVDRDRRFEYRVQVFLIATAIILAWFVLGHWPLLFWFAVTYSLSGVERYLHKRDPQPYSRKTYVTYLWLSSLIAVSATFLPLYLWTFQDRLYHFAALVYCVGAVLNTYVLRAKSWPALLSCAIPNAAGILGAAVIFVWEDGIAAPTLIALLLGLYISAYMLVLAREVIVYARLNKERTRKLLQSQRLETIASLSGGVAHDFNNLLAVISASLEEAAAEVDPKKRDEFYAYALSAVRRATGLTTQLLTTARQSDFQTTDIDVADFMEELGGLLQRVIPKSVSISVRVDERVKTIRTEPSLLQSMLLNLVMNSFQAMPDGGHIEIRVIHRVVKKVEMVSSGELAAGSYIAIDIVDDGKGIPSQVFGRVLEPFFSTREKRDSTGLGLSMVLGFAQQVGGALDLESEEGRGTKVSLLLPAHRGWDRDPSSEKRQDHVPGTVGGGVLLLVEDEASLRNILALHLTKSGYAVTSCADVAEAMAALEDGLVPDVVVSDIVLPGQQQGTDLVKYILDRFENTRCIMMTGYAFKAQTEESNLRKEKRVTRLSKPFPLAELDAVLRR